ncbi:hypothetical protein RFI_06785 [Reticulomyxa filosa]|uniref:Uncharacterized protein n=1 Tax=Reticulomyxa filosa TaxID=46433 RepID=X6NYG9_RETFI|nr:hypothetical protein RFI_06785 [Reticulomyxa filosa]|eukprot:ETO30337.1 hypothetical protein RFI_06785 [Reticulomyxa filosa]
MPVVSSRSGEWTASNAHAKTSLPEEEEIVNKDVAMSDVLDAMNEDMVADYMEIGLDSKANADGDGASNEKVNAIEEDESMANQSDSEENTEANEELPDPEEWLAQKKLRASKLKLEMASICEKMSEDPYAHVN